MSKPTKNKNKNKSIKKLPQTQKVKLKLKSLISLNDLTQKRFHDIITRLQDKTEFTAQDRYSLGVSFLKTKNLSQALIVFWPLIAHHTESPLQEDCAIIAHTVFNEAPHLLDQLFSDPELYTLFLIAKRFSPETAAFQTLKKRLLTALFEHKDYAKLETILKSTQDKYSLAFTENWGKLFFLQAETKSIGNVFSFIGRVLTGGGALILQTPIYHDAIAPAMLALAQALKQRLFALPEKQVEKFGDKTRIEQFIDYEAHILMTLLHTALSKPTHAHLLLTPSVFILQEEHDSTLRATFLPWLIEHCPELRQLYYPATQKAVLSMQSEKNLAEIQALLSSLQTIPNPLKPIILLNTWKLLRQHIEEATLWENIDALKHIAQRLQNLPLEKKLDEVVARRSACEVLFTKIKDEKARKKHLKTLKEPTDLKEQLVLVCDAYNLINQESAFLKCYDYLKTLTKDKRMNMLLPLKILFTDSFECQCPTCVTRFFAQTFPAVIQELALPVFSIKELRELETALPTTIKGSVLEQENPFTLLEISVTESKPAVMQKVMKLIQAFPAKMATIRHAQNEIFNPAQRFLHHYCRFVNDDFKSVTIDPASPISQKKTDIDKIPLREAMCHV